MEEMDDQDAFFWCVEARLPPLLPRLRRFRRNEGAEPPPGLRGSARSRQPDQGQRRDLADRGAQAAQQHQRARGLRRKHRRSHGSGWQAAGRRRHWRVAPAIDEGARRPGPEPITTLINTHWHFDHTDGNTWLDSVGAKIIAQDNTRKYLSEVQRVEDWDYNFLPPAPGGMPTETFADALDLKLNGLSLKLKLYAPAHTDSDISVNFAEANIVHVGDTFWNGVYPFIDYSTGGSIDGTIAACDVNLAAATADTIIIAGHGQPVSNKSELKEFRDMLVGVRENVATLKRQGRTRHEIVAAKPTAPYDAKFGAFVIDPGFFTRLVYEGV
jgi:glyoxylase-like metal-dependent hydrolase (beta-lactamase superfamily II)